MTRRNLGGLAVLLAGAAFLAFAAFLALPAVFRSVLSPEPADLAELRQAPHVARVKAPFLPNGATRCLVHVCDYHLVPRELHEGTEPYAEHLDDVGEVQREQLDLLRHLVERFGLRAISLEGLTAGTVPAYKEKVAALGSMERHGLQALWNQLAEAKKLKVKGSLRLEMEIRATLAKHREQLLSVGSPGRLLMRGELAEVRPLDDAGPLAAGDPRKADAAAMKARDDAIVRNALAGGEPVVVIVLGTGHDLAESVRAADAGCSYVRVVTRKVVELVNDR